MLILALALALPVAVSGSAPAMFVATSAEKASGFESLAECERALGKPGDAGVRGSVFNRAAGNVSRCELVDGEPMMVVYPRGHDAVRPAR